MTKYIVYNEDAKGKLRFYRKYRGHIESIVPGPGKGGVFDTLDDALQLRSAVMVRYPNTTVEISEYNFAPINLTAHTETPEQKLESRGLKLSKNSITFTSMFGACKPEDYELFKKYVLDNDKITTAKIQYTGSNRNHLTDWIDEVLTKKKSIKRVNIAGGYSDYCPAPHIEAITIRNTPVKLNKEHTNLKEVSLTDLHLEANNFNWKQLTKFTGRKLNPPSRSKGNFDIILGSDCTSLIFTPGYSWGSDGQYKVNASSIDATKVKRIDGEFERLPLKCVFPKTTKMDTITVVSPSDLTFEGYGMRVVCGDGPTEIKTKTYVKSNYRFNNISLAEFTKENLVVTIHNSQSMSYIGLPKNTSLQFPGTDTTRINSIDGVNNIIKVTGAVKFPDEAHDFLTLRGTFEQK